VELKTVCTSSRRTEKLTEEKNKVKQEKGAEIKLPDKND